MNLLATLIQKTLLADTSKGTKVGVELLPVELIGQIKGWASNVSIMPQFHRNDMIIEIIEKIR